MYRALALRLMLSMVGLLGGLWPAADAVAQVDVSYCVEGTHDYQTGCFPTLEKAESFMRLHTPSYADTLKQVRTEPMSGSRVKIVYDVDDQPPKSWQDKVFSHGGDTREICQLGGGEISTDPYNPYMCKSESAIVEGYKSKYLIDEGGCTYTNKRTSGAYKEPFDYIDSYGWPGPRGQLVSNSSANRRFEYDVYCTGWGNVPPSPRYISLVWFRGFECPVDFRARDAKGHEVNMPNVCEPNRWMPYIVTRVKQCNSCDTGGGSPATGNNEYSRTDFTWEGMPFTRHYNSSRDFPRDAGLGGNWSHPFADRITDTPYKQWLKPDGYVESFAQVTPTSFASRNETGIVLLKGADAAVPGSAWRILDGTTSRWFDTTGRLLQVRTAGREFRMIYCDATAKSAGICLDIGSLISVTSDTGRKLVFTQAAAVADLRYRDDARVSAVVSEILGDGGVLAKYGFDPAGRLASVTTSGATRQYLYGEPDRLCQGPGDTGIAAACAPGDFRYSLTGVIDEEGRRHATYSYDGSGRLLSSERAGGVDRVTLTYQSSTRVDVRLPLGATRQYTFQEDTNVRPASIATTAVDGVASSIANTYSSGRRTSSVENGVRTDYAYSDFKRTSERQALTLAGAGTAATRTVETDWDPTLFLPRERRIIDAGGILVQARSWTYTARGDTATSTVTDPASGSSRSTVSTYCEQADVDAGLCPRVGLLLKVDGARTDLPLPGDVTSFAYRMADAPGCDTSPATCAYRRGDLWKVTNAKNQTRETLSYDAAGRPLSVKDENGVVTDMEYTPRGWLQATKLRGSDPGSESDDAITRMDYWPTGLVRQVTQPDASYIVFDYDAAHRLTGISNSIGERIEYVLDAAGNRTREDTKDAQGNLKRTLSRVYNQLGQLQTARDAYSAATAMAYDARGNTDTVTDAKTRVTDNDYDPLGRLVQTLQDTAGIAAKTGFGYDALDNLRTVVDPKSLTTRYTYNGLGDLTKLVSPDTGTTDYSYDSAGNLRTRQDARGPGDAATYTYDELNRLTDISYATSMPDWNATYVYDTVNAVCGVGETFAVARLSRMQDGSGNTQYCYDRFGRMVRKVQTTNGNVFTTAYRYAVNGHLLGMTYPSGMRVDYGYNAAGQPDSVRVTRPGLAQETLVRSVRYLPFGPVSEIGYGDGTSIGDGRILSRQHDKNYRPTVVQDSTGIGLGDLLGWDEVGNLTSLADSLTTPMSTPLATYKYDGLNRLEGRFAPGDQAQTNPLQGYAYDATGNRTSDTKVTSATGTTTYSYPGTSHRLTQVGTAARTYNAMGSLLTGTVDGVARTYTYDVTGRMNVAKNGSTVAMNYAYNGKGEQVRRYPSATSTAQTYEVYNEAGQWIGEYDVNGARKQEYIWLGDLPVGVYALSPGSTTAYQVYEVQADHLGTPRVVIDASRNKAVWTWPLTGEAFGKTAPNQDPDADGKAFVLDMRFPGQRYDSASGLNYNYFRDYEAGSGRYVESDPIGLRGGANTFGYVFGRPTALIDPTGLSAAGAFQSLVDLGLWATGNLNSPNYGPNDAITSDLRKTPMWGEIWGKYKASGCKDGMQCGDFQYRQFFGTFSVVGQTVGSFCARFTRSGSKVAVRAYNTWGLESGSRLPALPGAGSNRGNPSVEQMFNGASFLHWPKSLWENNSTGFGATTRTTYNWTEDAPCCG